VSDESKKMSMYLNRIELQKDFRDSAQGERWNIIKEAMDKLPANRMISAINYIDANLLPAIKKKSGDQSPDYLFFKDVIEMLMQSMVMYDRMRMLRDMYANAKIDAEILRERVLMYEGELNKYTTLEDIYLNQGLEYYEKGIRQRMEAELRRKKG
jgi:hypothetical protein